MNDQTVLLISIVKSASHSKAKSIKASTIHALVVHQFESLYNPQGAKLELSSIQNLTCKRLREKYNDSGRNYPILLNSIINTAHFQIKWNKIVTNEWTLIPNTS